MIHLNPPVYPFKKGRVWGIVIVVVRFIARH